jgi:hypothetical protein
MALGYLNVLDRSHHHQSHSQYFMGFLYCTVLVCSISLPGSDCPEGASMLSFRDPQANPELTPRSSRTRRSDIAAPAEGSSLTPDENPQRKHHETATIAQPGGR